MHTTAVDNYTVHVCKNCGNQFTGQYCNACGEKRFSDHDKSIAHFFEEAIHFLTHFEGNFFTSLKAIFQQPGKLSLDYCNGIRKRYFKPLPMFMLLVVLYLIFPIFSGLNMEMKYYPRLPLFKPVINKMIAHKMAAKQLTFDQLTEVYQHKSEKTSKLMLIVWIPLAAFVIKILYPTKRKYFFDYLVLSAEINSFFLFFTFFIFAGTVVLLKLIRVLPESQFHDGSLLMYSSLFFVAAFVTRSFSRFFAENRWVSFLKMLFFLVVYIFIVYILYKFLLFAVTMLFI